MSTLVHEDCLRVRTQKAIVAAYGDEAIQALAGRLCAECKRRGATIKLDRVTTMNCDLLLLPLRSDGGECVYFEAGARIGGLC